LRIGSGCSLLGPLFPSQQPPFAGKTPLPAESYVRPFGRVPILAVGPETGPREGSMAAQQTTPRSLTPIAGAVLLALGFLMRFANLDTAVTRIAEAAGTSGGNLLETLPALILAVLHGLRAYAFDHAGFLSGVLQSLVSFWPLILILAGALLLRDVFRGRFPAYKPGTGSSTAKGADA